MNIDEELKEMKAIHAAFDDLVAHSTSVDEGHIAVSIQRLKTLQRRIDRLYEALDEACAEAQRSRDAATPAPVGDRRSER